MTYHISESLLDLATIRQIIDQKQHLALSTESRKKITDCYDYLHQKIQGSEAAFYGINTGFGSLCDIKIEKDKLEQLQTNLVRSHACGMGDEVPTEVVQIMLLLKIRNLSLGHSGTSLALIERLIDLYNAGAYPVIYQLGSLGASGDLSPLAHLSLPLIGEGEVYYKNQKIKTAELLAQQGWEPIKLQAKEGLALLNGTQFSTAYGVWSLLQTQQLSEQADSIAAMSIDGFACLLTPFDERLHLVRPHPGQLQTAARIRTLLQGSELAAAPKETVQDPYAFRCIPQVHGASKDTIDYAKRVVEIEINSVTDNPNIFADSDAILSGGNFHAQPIALALDFLAIALAELGSISERRVYQLISGKRGLPPFLTPHSGLHSGLMITQYTAASIVSQNKQLCSPASVDSIVSCNGQEDHVSMAANAATKLYRVTQNVQRLLAIEIIAAGQALSLRKLSEEASSSSFVEQLLVAFRKYVPILDEDRLLQEDLHQAVLFLQETDVFES